MKKHVLSFLCVFIICFHWGQGDFGAIDDFRNHHVIFTDLGFNASPFSIRYPFSSNLSKIKYKNNFKPMLGIGYAYKWFSLRIAFPIMAGFKNENLYGNSKQFNLTFDYSFKRIYMDFEFKTVESYVIKDAFLFDSTLSIESPHKIIPSLSSLNFSLNGWYFNHDDFKMNALLGRRAHFKKEVHTWYIKSTFNVFGIENNGNSIIPLVIQNSSNSKTASATFSSFDFGALPGYAYANRIKNWQFSGWAGLGMVIQSKFFTNTQNVQGFLGLAPRYDLRMVGGYTSTKYFILLVADFDNKSIRFNDLVYRQNYYTVRLVGGIRFPSKKMT